LISTSNLSKTILKKHRAFIIICGLLVAVGVLLSLTWYRYQLNPDATSYFSIAASYAHLQFGQAINGYWGPMFSWLLVPAVWLHLNLIIAAKLLNLAVAVIILVTVYRFLLAREVSRTVADLVSFWLGIVLVSMAATQPITPDMLVGLLVLWFAIRLNGFMAAPTPTRAAVIGLIGALMYLAKGFGFYLFLAVVGLVALWQWYRTKHLGVIIRRYLPLAVVFVVLVLPFMVAISVKYHHLTISTAGSFDKNLFGPVSKGVDYPMMLTGPLAPPNHLATSVWEDPTYLIPLIPGTGWSPLGSVSNLSYFVHQIVEHNLSTTLTIIAGYGSLVAVGVMVLILDCLRRKPERPELRVFGLIAAVTAGGYCLIYVEPRYLLGPAVLATMAAGLWFSKLQQKRIFSYWQILAGGLILGLVSLHGTAQVVIQGKNLDKSYYQTAQSLQGVVPPHAKIISDDFNSFALCYYLQAQCYGVLTPPASNIQRYDQNLKRLGVGYYVDYHTRDSDTALQSFVARYFTPVSQYASGALVVTTYRVR
jgi:hypothetical protein